MSGHRTILYLHGVKIMQVLLLSGVQRFLYDRHILRAKTHAMVPDLAVQILLRVLRRKFDITDLNHLRSFLLIPADSAALRPARYPVDQAHCRL